VVREQLEVLTLLPSLQGLREAADQALVTSSAQSDMSSPNRPRCFWSGHISSTELALGRPSVARPDVQSQVRADVTQRGERLTAYRPYLSAWTRKPRTPRRTFRILSLQLVDGLILSHPLTLSPPAAVPPGRWPLTSPAPEPPAKCSGRPPTELTATRARRH
jgi:hypothetical protein